SLWLEMLKGNHHRGTENTEVAQRNHCKEVTSVAGSGGVRPTRCVDFMRYISLSAATTSWSRVSPSTPNVAVPILIPTRAERFLPSGSENFDTALSIRIHKSSTCAPTTSCTSATNSSPPERARKSYSRNCPAIRCATSRNILSPAL